MIDVDLFRDGWDWVFEITAAIGALAAAAAVVVSVITAVRAAHETQVARKRADAAEKTLRDERAQAALERRARQARQIRLDASWEPDPARSGAMTRTVAVRVVNASTGPITALQIGAYDATAIPVPTHPGGQVNPVMIRLEPGETYEGRWLVEDVSDNYSARFPPIVAIFNDQYLQSWQLVNGQHLRFGGSADVIEEDSLPNVRFL